MVNDWHCDVSDWFALDSIMYPCPLRALLSRLSRLNCGLIASKPNAQRGRDPGQARPVYHGYRVLLMFAGLAVL